MNKDIGQPIAHGRTAEIYSWEGGQILKSFYDWYEPGDIEYEQRMNRAVHASGLPVPAPGGIIQVNGHNCLIYERVDGQNMWDVLAKQPWRLVEFARQTADLHAEMHANTTRPEIPSLHRKLEFKLLHADQLSPAIQEAARAALVRLPDGSSICHGDFHPANILLAPKRAVIIDWIDASLGNPLADVARTSVICMGAVISNEVQNPALKLGLRLFHTIYLHRYFRLRPGGETEYQRWIPIVAAARLSENIPELESWLIETARKGLL
jgi:serine/threonine protein kinase